MIFKGTQAELKIAEDSVAFAFLECAAFIACSLCVHIRR